MHKTTTKLLSLALTGALALSPLAGLEAKTTKTKKKHQDEQPMRERILWTAGSIGLFVLGTTLSVRHQGKSATK